MSSPLALRKEQKRYVCVVQIGKFGMSARSHNFVARSWFLDRTLAFLYLYVLLRGIREGTSGQELERLGEDDGHE